MGQIISRYFGRKHEEVREEEEDTADLIEAQVDRVRQDDKENCFQYLKRKFTNVFTQQSFPSKRTRLDEENYQNVEPVPVHSEDLADAVVEEIQTDNPVVDIHTKEEQRTDSIHEVNTNIEIEEDPTDERLTEPYLDHPILTDKSSMESMKNSLTMIIMRGMPGSGKSTIVRKLKELYPEASSCSADDYFLQCGSYVFDRTKLKDAHQFSQAKAEELCRNLTRLVIIDNTNVKRWEMTPYFRTAANHRYTVILVEPRTPWRYGWFLNTADTDQLLQFGNSWLEKCISVKEFFEDFSCHSNRYNLRSMLMFFSRDMMGRGSKEKCHCTTRFIRRGDTAITPEEEEMLGSGSYLLITALIITPRTFGAKVQLSPAQLTVYSQNDNEVEVMGVPNKPAQPPPRPRPQKESPPRATVREAISACNPTFVTTEEKTEKPVVGERGGRAHITLGCAEGVRPVQTGLDQIQVGREVATTSIPLQGGVLEGYGGGRWVVRLDRAAKVQAVFSGEY